MKKNLIVKAIAGGIITLAPLASLAATATITSDYFSVDTRAQYTIHFDANGGTGKMDDMSGSSYAELLNAIVLPEPTGFIESPSPAHKFLGWGLSADVDGVNNPDKLVKTTDELYGHFSENGRLTLFAIWGKTFTVSFDANFGTGIMPPQTFWDGKKQKLSKNTYTKGSNKFIGWAESSDEAGKGIVKYGDEDEFPKEDSGNSDKTLYAVWTTSVTVSFYNSEMSNGGKVLVPASLGDHLRWKVEGEDVGVWHRQGEAKELEPGKYYKFLFTVVDGAAWLAWLESLDEKAYIPGTSEFNSAPWSAGSAFQYKLEVKVGVEGGSGSYVIFDYTAEKIDGQKFDPSKANITLTYYGPAGTRTLFPDTYKGLSLNEGYTLPWGVYTVSARTSGDEWITPEYDINLTVGVDSIRRVYLDFFYNGSTDERDTLVGREIKLNPNSMFAKVEPGVLKVRAHYWGEWMQIPRLPTPEYAMHEFKGWWTEAKGGTMVKEGDRIDGRISVLYAHWSMFDALVRRILPASVSTSASVSLTQTHTFVSYLQLPDDGKVAGTMTIKTQKERGGVVSATVTIQSLDGKRQTIKGTISAADGTGQGALAGLTFTTAGVTGTLNGYSVDGAMDASKSKDAATVAVLNEFKGKAYVMALQPEEVTGANAAAANGDVGFSVVFSMKGKAKVTGMMPDGTKVSVSSQLIVGSEWCCLPVVYSKTGNSLAFLMWFDRAGNFDSVSGLTTWKGKGFEVTWSDDVTVSKVGNLSGASYFNLEEIPTKLGGTSIVKQILPINVKVTPNGAKWDIPKSSPVKMDRSGTLVYGANPSALKLTYKAKTGTFSGSVTFYTEAGGRLKKIRATVNGIVVDGVGYGTALVKKQGAWPVVIGPDQIEVASETAGVVLPSNFVGEYTGFIEDSSKTTGNPKWPMHRGTLTMSIGVDGETQVFIDSILGKVSFSAKGWDYYSNAYGYADVVLMGNGGEQLTLRVQSDSEWYFPELSGSVAGGIFGATKMTIYGERNRFTDSWGTEVKDGVKAFLAKQTGSHRIAVSSINYGGGYPYNWEFGIANEGEDAPLTLTIDDDGTATVSGTLNGRKIEGVTQILFWTAEYYARANFYLQLDAKTECLLSFALYSCYEPWQNIVGEGWMRNIP